jgi:hypothetical protein
MKSTSSNCLSAHVFGDNNNFTCADAITGNLPSNAMYFAAGHWTRKGQHFI